MLLCQRTRSAAPTARGAQTDDVLVLRMIAQHEHALLSGELARAWVGVDGREPLSFGCILATTLHDLAWLEADRRIAEDDTCFDAERGLPHDFMTFPSAPKLAMYASGLDAVEQLDGWSALLGSLHYSGFGHEAGFTEGERARRARLAERVAHGQDEARAARELRLLQWFDWLSLALCLSAPGSRSVLPAWLRAPLIFDEVEYRLHWRSEDHVEVAPWPFASSVVERHVVVRDVPLPPGGRFADRASFAAACALAPQTVWPLRLTAGARGA